MAMVLAALLVMSFVGERGVMFKMMVVSSGCSVAGYRNDRWGGKGWVRRGDSGVVGVQVHVTVSLVVMVIVLVALLVMSLVGERGEC